MNPARITEAANQIDGFAQLPVIAQISLLYSEIESARAMSIPTSVICAAMNKAGSGVTVKYFRDAISTVRKRMKKSNNHGACIVEPKPPSTPQAPKPAQQTGTLTPSKERERKVSNYMDSSNPLLKKSNKE